MRKPLWAVAAAAAVLAGAAGWVASSAPDGLERASQSLGFAPRARPLIAAPLADYQARFLSGLSGGLAQAAAGVAGVALVYGFGVLLGRALRRKS